MLRDPTTLEEDERLKEVVKSFFYWTSHIEDEMVKFALQDLAKIIGIDKQ